MKTQLVFKTHFDSAHRLMQYDGPCWNLHGHRWGVDLVIEGEKNQQTGMIIDFKELKELLSWILPDHRYLNDEFPNVEPTCENLAGLIFMRFKRDKAWQESGLKLISLTLWETPDAGARVCED